MNETIRILSGKFNPRSKVAIIDPKSNTRELHPDGLVGQRWVGAYGREFKLWHPAKETQVSVQGFDSNGVGHNNGRIAVNYEVVR